MIGTYRIYEDGRLINEFNNVVTATGKQIITRFLAKNNSSWAGAMAVGVGRTAANAADAALECEYARFPVYYSYGFYDGAYKIILKSEMSESFAGAIEEIGVYSLLSGGNAFSSEFSLFKSTDDWMLDTVTIGLQSGIADTSVNADSKIKSGVVGYKVTGNGSLYKDFSSINFGDYGDTDRFALAYGLATSGTIQVRFEKDSANYFATANITTPTSNNGLHTWTKTSMTKTGSLDWSEIKGIRISISNNTGGVCLDVLRPVVVNHYDNNYGLVSRAVSGAEDSIIKRLGSRFDLEYEVTLNL